MKFRDVSGDSAKALETTVRMTHDGSHLYVALQCRHDGKTTVEPASEREHDMDRSGQDRVELTLDLDRDYQTYYRFSVDRRGAVAEDCWGDKSWNPRWFVAVKEKPFSWTAELAIPLTELTGSKPDLGEVWAANAVRTIPNVGVQAWSLPAGVKPRPEGMGLIQFVGRGE